MNEPSLIAQELMQKDENIIACVIVQDHDNIIFTTENWDISSDINALVSNWDDIKTQSIMVSGIKYSILQHTPERLVATSIKGEGHILGTKDDTYKIIIYLEPEGNPMGAMMDVARSLSELNPIKNNSYMEQDNNLPTKNEVQNFLAWITNNGLSEWITYYMEQNNTIVISELSKVYFDLKQIFGIA